MLCKQQWISNQTTCWIHWSQYPSKWCTNPAVWPSFTRGFSCSHGTPLWKAMPSMRGKHSLTVTYHQFKIEEQWLWAITPVWIYYFVSVIRMIDKNDQIQLIAAASKSSTLSLTSQLQTDDFIALNTSL